MDQKAKGCQRVSVFSSWLTTDGFRNRASAELKMRVGLSIDRDRDIESRVVKIASGQPVLLYGKLKMGRCQMQWPTLMLLVLN